MTFKGGDHNVKARLNAHTLINDDRQYVDIRIAPKANKNSKAKNQTTDISIYLPFRDGERLKVKSQCWSNGRITCGYDDPALMKEINIFINTLCSDVESYLLTYPNSSKQLIEVHVYGADNLAKWKKQRIVYRDIALTKSEPSPTHQELRKSHGMRKNISKEKVTTVEDDFEVTREVDKVTIIDPLSLVDFPNNFDPKLYAAYREKFLQANPTIAQGRSESFRNNVINSFLKKKIERELFTKTTETIRIDKNVLKEYERRKKTGKVDYGVSAETLDGLDPLILAALEQPILLDLKKEVEANQKAYKDALTPADEWYRSRQFDKSDLFEVFTSGFYQVFPNRINKPSILWRLLEYKFKGDPSSKVSDFSVDWCKAFLTFIFDNGIVATNFKTVDPSEVTAKTFQGKTIKYSKDNYADVIKWLKDAVKKLTALKLLPSINLTEISIKNFLTEEDLKNIDPTPQDEKGLTKPEFDKLFFHTFKDKELDLARDRFVLLVMFGGLRINEFRPDKVKTGGNLQIEDDGYGYKCVRYNTSHQRKLREMANPVNEYADAILKKHGYKIPFYSDKQGNPTKPDENHMNRVLKLMGKELGFLKRKVKDKQRNNKGEMVSVKVAIEDDLSSLYARHSVYPIFKFKEMPHEQIRYFAGHSGKKDSSHHYDPKLFKDVAHKRKQLEKYGIKPE